MTFTSLKRIAAALTLAAVAACSGGGTVAGPTPVQTLTPQTTSKIVGVGDSLTAGYQSAGWYGGPVGEANYANPLCTNPVTCPAAPLGVPPGQESGWWSQLWMQANGASQVQYAMLAAPATSVLPLIGKPGLGNQIVPADPTQTGGIPFGTIPGRTGCDTFNQEAYQRSSAINTVRENGDTQALDLGIPGITLHEAIAMNQPISPTCVAISSNALISGLQSLLTESGNYYPVLGTQPQGATMLSTAESLNPTIATVWLGANDVLHYAFSGGTFTAIDGYGGNTAQVTSDMTTIISGLQKTGAKVVVANLPDVIKTGFFMSTASLSPAQCETAPYVLGTYLTCIIAQVPQLAPYAQNITAQYAATYNLGTTGYVTLGGAIAILTAAAQGKTANLDPNGAGSGLGQNYVTPALAASIQTLNNTLNAGIAAAASANKVPLVDVHSFFNDIASGCASGCTSDPLALQALTLNPGKCCTLAFGGGLLSFDGLHPSNTGYAFIAQAFIETIDTAYGTSIPPLVVLNQYNGTGTIPFPDPYARH